MYPGKCEQRKKAIPILFTKVNAIKTIQVFYLKERKKCFSLKQNNEMGGRFELLSDGFLILSNCSSVVYS